MLLDCENCGAKVKAEIICSYETTNEADWMDSYKYSLCKCPQCESPLVTEQSYDIEHNEVIWTTPRLIYPSGQFHINPVIPEKLRGALIECILCFKAKSFTATVIMCRRALEGFASIKGVEEKNLDKSIKRLKDEGIINEQLYEWANELRLSGNEAVHNIDAQFSSLDAKDILDFTIAILDFTFSFKDKFDRFKRRNIMKKNEPNNNS